MGYMDAFNKQGIRLSVRHGNILWFDPVELIPDELMSTAREHKDELIAEIKGLSDGIDASASELIPPYRFLWAATTLELFEEYDPRYGYELGRAPVFRMLDAPYYAWLRHQMENASKAHKAGRISDDEFAVLRDRFNVIHGWAIANIGEDTLRRAMRTTNIKRYIPPCDVTIKAYHQSWAEARKDNEVRRRRMLESHDSDPKAAKLAHLLRTQGYVGIKSSVVDDIVVFIRDDSVIVPSKWNGKVRFTQDELTLMAHSSAEDVKQIYSIKQIFGGKVVPADRLENNVVKTGSILPGNQAAMVRHGSPAPANTQLPLSLAECA